MIVFHTMVFLDIKLFIMAPYLKERALMHPRRLLKSRYITCTLLCISSLLVVQNGSACRWRAELFNYTTQETSPVRIRTTPVTLPLVQREQGVQVTCGLAQSDLLTIGTVQSNKVDILCRYPDDQLLTARAIMAFDSATGDTMTHPVLLFFSNVRQYDKPSYRLNVDCQ